MTKKANHLMTGALFALFTMLLVLPGSVHVAAAEECIGCKTTLFSQYNMSFGQIQGVQITDSEGTIVREDLAYIFNDHTVLENPDNMSYIINETSDYAQRFGMYLIAGCSRENLTEQLSMPMLGNERIITSDNLALHQATYLSGSTETAWWYDGYYVTAVVDQNGRRHTAVGITNPYRMQDPTLRSEAYDQAKSYALWQGIRIEENFFSNNPEKISDAATKMIDWENSRFPASLYDVNDSGSVFNGVAMKDSFEDDRIRCREIIAVSIVVFPLPTTVALRPL